MKYLKALFGIGIFVVLLFAVYVGYIKFFKVDVVFYSSLLAAAIALGIFSLLLVLMPVFSVFSAFEKVQHLAVCALLGYIWAISVPTVIDRSLSFYILEKLQQRGGGIQLAKFNYIFTTEYMREHRLVEVRLTEQVKSGTIVIDGKCVRLTSKGDNLASFSRFFRQNLLPRQRLLGNGYTDELTDPFARSDDRPDYLCR